MAVDEQRHRWFVTDVGTREEGGSVDIVVTQL